MSTVRKHPDCDRIRVNSPAIDLASHPEAPARHEHLTTDEAFYCAAGEASFKLGGGELGLVPRGTIHTAWNAGSEDMRGIIFITPGDVEHEFVEV